MNSQYNTTKVFVAACAGMAFFGVTMLSLGPLLGRIAELGVNANALPPTLTAGIIFGTILFGPIVDRFGYKALTIIGLMLSLSGMLGLNYFSTDMTLQISICGLGMGGGLLNGITNALVADIYDDDHRSGHMSILGAFYCIGALLWTLLNFFIADYHIPLYVMSSLMALTVIYYCFIGFPKAKPAEAVGFGKTLGLFKYPALIMFGLVLFFQSGVEGSTGDFTVTYLTKANGLSTASATLAMTWFTVGMLIGRLLLDEAIKRLKDVGTFYLYLGIALAGVAVLYFSTAATGAYIAMTLLGLGLGATFPVILGYVGGTFRNLSGTAISIVVLIALIGQFTLKKVTGTAFNAGSYESLPLIVGIAIATMMVLVPVTIRIANKTKY